MKKIMAVMLLIGTAYAQPERHWWVFRGFGSDMVQCELKDNRVTHCHYLNSANLDGVMEAVHRATKASIN